MTKINQKSLFWGILIVFVIGLSLRLILAAVVPPAHDIDAWSQYSDYWQQGRSPYLDYERGARYKYSPVWFWIITACSFLSQKSGLSFAFSIRLPMILADAGIFFILLKTCSAFKYSSKMTLLVLGAFFLNPVSLQLSGYSGQFDNISLFFGLAAWYAQSFFQAAFVLGLLFLGLSIAAKHLTAMIAPIFAFHYGPWFKKVAFLAGAPVLFLASLLPYFEGNPQSVIHHVFQYNLHAGYWGWSGIICRSVLFFSGIDLVQESWFKYLNYFNSFLYLGIFVSALLDGIVMTFLIFYTFTTQIAPQYTVWIIPFAVLRPNRYFYAYSVIGGIQIAFFYYCHHFWWQYIPVGGPFANFASETFVIFRHLTWLVCVVWFLDHSGILKKLKWAKA